MKAGTHGNRVWSQWGPVLALLAVLCLMTGGFLIDRAAPETPNLFDKRWSGAVRKGWDLDLARLAGGLFLAALSASGFGLLMHTLLDRHRADASTWILLLSGLVGVFALIYTLSAASLG